MTFGKWWDFTQSNVSLDKESGAVYQFGDSGDNVIYIGSTNSLKRRLNEHLGEDAKSCIKANAKKYCYDYRSDYAAEEKRLYDDFVRRNGRPPRCNDQRPPG